MINMTQQNNRNDAAILAGIFLLIFVILGVWGGLPPQEEVPFFVLGIVMLVIMTMVSGFAAWHLL
jgi:quinol-cytochrome oxidoreductase complex cytochrome b subunit